MANLTQKEQLLLQDQKVMKNCALKIYKLRKSIKGSTTKTDIFKQCTGRTRTFKQHKSTFKWSNSKC